MTELEEGDKALKLTCAPDLWDVRRVVMRVERFLDERKVVRERIDDVNLALTEAMTNIVRHNSGKISADVLLCIRLGARHLTCKLSDHGCPYDPTSLGHFAPLPADLNEGGYGWFLIRALSENLEYVREDGRNILSFAVPLRATGA
ncbi:MAG: ATP-binding protein [Roseinatronobacter sp.]